MLYEVITEQGVGADRDRRGALSEAFDRFAPRLALVAAGHEFDLDAGGGVSPGPGCQAGSRQPVV